MNIRSHTYVECTGAGDYIGTPECYYACCEECDWEGPCRYEHAGAARDQRWHPSWWCSLSAWWQHTSLHPKILWASLRGFRWPR